MYVDLNHLSTPTLLNFYNLVANSINRNLLEKKLTSKFEASQLSVEEAKEFIKAQVAELVNKNYSVVFFVEDVDKILTLGPEIFELFEALNALHQKFSIIYLVRKNIAHPKHISEFAGVPHLTQNLVYMNIRDEKSLRSIERGMTPHMFTIIYDLTGGIDKFHGVATDLKNNLPPRKRKDLKKTLLENWHLINEVRKLWEGFSDNEIELLTQIVWGVKEFDHAYDKDLEHLLNLGLIQKVRGNYKIVVGMLKIVGSEKAKNGLKNVVVSKTGVTINGNKVPLKLSVGEKKVLTKLVSNKNKIVGKRDIAKSMGSKRKGSDDVLVSATVQRLKDKLSTVWVNPGNFVMVEGRGVIYRE